MATNVPTTDIILAAVGAAGPVPEKDGKLAKGEWTVRVREIAGELAIMLDEHSSMSKHVDRFKSVEKPFVAVILGGGTEKTSGRALVRFRAEKGEEDEEIRTHHLNTPQGKSVWEQVKSLKDHRVLIYKYMEPGANGKEYRILQHIVDLGLPSEG